MGNRVKLGVQLKWVIWRSLIHFMNWWKHKVFQRSFKKLLVFSCCFWVSAPKQFVEMFSCQKSEVIVHFIGDRHRMIFIDDYCPSSQWATLWLKQRHQLSFLFCFQLIIAVWFLKVFQLKGKQLPLQIISMQVILM